MNEWTQNKFSNSEAGNTVLCLISTVTAAKIACLLLNTKAG